MDCFCGGVSMTKNKKCDKDLKGLKDKVRLLQDEVKFIISERERESRVYEKDMMVFAFKEAEWKQERKRMKEEVKKLKKTVEEKEEKIKGMEDCGFLVEKNVAKDSWQVLGSTTTTITSSLLVEQMKEERALRDEAVDKWKKLYLAIKTELDDLIQRTHRGDGLYWRIEEEEIIEELKLEVKRKEETIQELKARLASVEHEEYKKAREIDILRQSLRIMSNRKVPPSFTLGKPKLALVKHAKKAHHCH